LTCTDSGLSNGTTYYYKVTASNPTGESAQSSEVSATPVAPSSCAASQLLGDPGFESGGTGSQWSATSGVFNNSSSEPPHSGSWDAWLDGYSSAHTDTLSQTVTIPSGCNTSTLSFWLHIDTAQTGTSAIDTLKVQLLNTTLATYSNLNAASGYVQKSLDVGAYAGQTVTLKFTGVQAGSTQTSFVLDDTALNASGSGGTGGCTAAQLLKNPGFEDGPSQTAWTWTSTLASASQFFNSSSSEPPHSGTYDAWMNGWGRTDTDKLAQAVTITSSCANATLTFWLHIDTAETTTTTKYDTLKLQILNSSGTVLATPGNWSNLDHNTGYKQWSVNLDSYIGQTITVKFTGSEDASFQTSFVLDDAAVNVS
jgi:hypothetical protein